MHSRRGTQEGRVQLEGEVALITGGGSGIGATFVVDGGRTVV